MLSFQRNRFLFQSLLRSSNYNQTFNSSVKAPTPTTITDEDFMNIIEFKPKIAPTPTFGKANNLQELSLLINKSRPTNDLHLCSVLNDLATITKKPNQTISEVLQFLKAEKINVSVAAHVLNDNVSVSSVLSATTSMGRIFSCITTDFTKLNADSEEKIVFTKLLQKCDATLKTAPFANLKFIDIYNLYFLLKKYNALKIQPGLKEILEEKICIFTNDVQSIQYLFGMIDNIPLTQDQIKQVIAKAYEFLPNLSCEDTITLMYYMGKHRFRSLNILQELAQHLEHKSDEKLTPKNLIKLCQNMITLSFHDMRLCRTIYKSFMETINEFQYNKDVIFIMSSLSQMNFVSNEFIKTCEDWLLNNYENMYPYDLSTSLSFFAKVDHDKIKISGPINLALSRFDVKNFSKPIFLLKHAYDLVILDSLNARLAEYVLRPVFLTSVIEDIDETKKAYILQLIAQIGCYTKLNIKDYKGSFPKLSNYSNIDDKLVEQYQLFSYVKKDSVFISNANKLVTRVAGSEVVCSGPIVINEGILINNCVKLSANHKFAKEENWAKFINSNDKTFTKTAIIYVSQKNMLKNFQTAEPIRHDGVIGLKLRLLKQLGFKVATIYDRIFNGKESSVDKLNYIKEQIYKKD